MPYQGEEGVYTITSLEMWFHQEWINPLFYGGNYGRPPLFNWLIIPLASFLGWEHVLVASRFITASASFATSLVLFWLMRQLFRDKTLAWLAAAIYLSGDLLFKRGWLAYADPLFSLFVFSAISFLWVGLEKKQVWLFVLANLFLGLAFLSKALTAYFFYMSAFLVLFWRHENRRFLFSPLVLMLLCLALLFPLVWNMLSHDGAHGKEMMVDVVSRLSSSQLNHYFIKIIIYPFSTLLYWMPASGILFYLFWQSKKQKINGLTHIRLFNNGKSLALLSIAFWILMLNYIPYWLAPQNRIRYILPLYPLFALIAASIIYYAGEKTIRITSILLGICVLVKFFLAIYGYALIEKNMRGDYFSIAQDIIQKTQGYPLYVDDDSATGLSVTANIDVLRLPQAPLTRCVNKDGVFQKDGFYIVNNLQHYQNTQVFQEYTLGRNKLYLLCNGKACYKKNMVQDKK